jgi:uncharacterized membrane protein YqhA
MTRFLAACRFILVVPVIGCVLLTAGVVLMGMGRIITAAIEIVGEGDFSAKAAKTLSLEVIETIDLFLVGTVAYIVAVGLYKLFISDMKIALPMRLKIRNLKDLEDKISGVIVVALGVTFLGHVIGAIELEPLLNYGAGIALVIAALAFSMRPGDKTSDQTAEAQAGGSLSTNSSVVSQSNPKTE